MVRMVTAWAFVAVIVAGAVGYGMGASAQDAGTDTTSPSGMERLIMLTDRVNELEATVEAQNDRIGWLEFYQFEQGIQIACLTRLELGLYDVSPGLARTTQGLQRCRDAMVEGMVPTPAVGG